MTPEPEGDEPTPPSLHVIGSGLIGTSVALAAARAGWVVSLDDADASRAKRAAELVAHLVGREQPLLGSGPGSADASDRSTPVAAAVTEPDLVCVAVPPRWNGPVLIDVLRRYVDATVMDVCSVKSASHADVEAAEVDQTRLVWSHPLAGAESSGPEAARPDLFDGRTWIVCTAEGATAPAPEPGRRRLVEQLVTACRARPLAMSTTRHDELLAMTSHLPQLVSSALAGEVVAAFSAAPDAADLAPTADEMPPPSLLAGPGLLDMTRIAGSPSELWAQIATMNRVPVQAGLRRLTSRLRELERSLDDPDATADAVTALVDDGRSARRVLDRKHAGTSGRAVPAAAPDWTWVRTTIADVPGTLARVFAVAGELGVNIEDVQVDHAPYASQGLVSVAVRTHDAQRLADRLA